MAVHGMTVLLLLSLAQAGTERKQIEVGVLAAARHIVRGVENKRAEDILAHVSPEGAPCIDSVITRQQYESDLQSKGNYIHAYFFDATEFNDRFRSAIDPISLAELVARGGELSYRVHFQRFPGRRPQALRRWPLDRERWAREAGLARSFTTTCPSCSPRRVSMIGWGALLVQRSSSMTSSLIWGDYKLDTTCLTFR